MKNEIYPLEIKQGLFLIVLTVAVFNLISCGTKDSKQSDPPARVEPPDSPNMTLDQIRNQSVQLKFYLDDYESCLKKASVEAQCDIQKNRVNSLFTQN